MYRHRRATYWKVAAPLRQGRQCCKRSVSQGPGGTGRERGGDSCKTYHTRSAVGATSVSMGISNRTVSLHTAMRAASGYRSHAAASLPALLQDTGHGSMTSVGMRCALASHWRSNSSRAAGSVRLSLAVAGACKPASPASAVAPRPKRARTTGSNMVAARLRSKGAERRTKMPESKQPNVASPPPGTSSYTIIYWGSLSPDMSREPWCCQGPISSKMTRAWTPWGRPLSRSIVRRPDVTAPCHDKFDLNHELGDSVVTTTYYTYMLSS
jgi:hypothetical protein